MPPSPTPSAPSRDGRPSPTVSVVIPVRNEAARLPLVLRALPPVDEVIVVDGGSADDTVAAARAARPGVRVLRQGRSGKGNALACGFAASTGDIVVTLNGDGSTDPAGIPRLVDAVLAGADVAHGSRYRDGGGNLTGGRLERIGAAILSRLVGVLFGVRVTDPGWGYNAYRRDVLPALGLPGPEVPGLRRGRRAWGDGPEIGTLVNIRTAARGLRVVEVAGVGQPRMHGGQRRDLLSRALRALRTLVAEYLRHRRDRSARGATTAGRRSAGPAPMVRTAPAVRPARIDRPAPVLLPASPGTAVTGWEPARRVATPSAGERPSGRHAAPAGTAWPGAAPVPPRRGPLPSGLPSAAPSGYAVPVPPGPRAAPSGLPRRRTAAAPGPPPWPIAAPAGRTSTPSPAPPARAPGPWPGAAPPGLPAGTSYGRPAAAARAGRDQQRTPADRRQGYPGPRPAWARREPGAHRTVDINDYDTGVRGGRVYDTGAHHLPGDDPGRPAPRGGRYDTGAHRAGVYASGVHRTDVHDTGAHHLPDPDGPLYRTSAPREVGGGRRRLDARDHRADGRPDLTVIPGAGPEPGGTDHGRSREDGGRPGHLRAVPGEPFPR
jgi:hypothetical protein